LSEELLLRDRISALESELALQRRLGQHTPGFCWTTDLDLRLNSCCGVYTCRLATRAENLLGTKLRECFAGSEADGQVIAASHAALRGESVSFSADWLGQSHRISLAPLRTDDGRVCGTLGIAVNTAEERRIEDLLATSERRYRDLVDHSTELVFSLDMSGGFIAVNNAAEQLLGYERGELLRMRLQDVLASGVGLGTRVLQHDLSGRGPEGFEATLRTRQGELLLVELKTYLLRDSAGLPSGVQGIARDLTAQRHLEEQLRQSQKMEAIGVLAGGVAHDFNNLLTGILGNAFLLKSRIPDNAGAVEAVHGIIDASEKASQLTRQLLGFARRSSNQSEPIDLHKIVRSVVDLLSRTIDKRVRIVTLFEAQRAEILGDAGQMYQMVLNLALNARDAMPDGGELRLGTRVEDSELILTVRDSGVGIPESIREHIFEAFFTTKEPEKGTGLGLAMVYGIVQHHGGRIRFESDGKTGTAFEVSLPLATKTVPEPGKAAGGETPRLRGRILVIDDEPVVRRVLSKMLQELGFEVTGSEDSLEAIEFYRGNHQAIDLVILDLVMPKLGGGEVLARLRAIQPRIKAILSTGYDRDGVVTEILKQGNVSFLQKPYTMDSLAKVVQQALDGGRPEDAALDPLHADRAI